MAKNPNWARDELILALDLYFKIDPAHNSRTHPDVIALSTLLNALPIHSDRDTNPTFRNPSSVYMKLCNFLSLDPEYHGIGLSSASQLDSAL